MWLYFLSLSALALGYGGYRLSKINKVKMALQLITYFAKNSNSKSSVTIKGNYAIIEYIYNNTNHKLHIPFYIDLRCNTIGTKVYLLHEDGKRDVTHQPGFPYLLTASQLGGNGYLVITPDGDREFGPEDLISF